MHLIKIILFFSQITCVSTAFTDWEWKAHPGIEQEFKSSTIVIVGKVLRAKDVPEPDGFIRGTYYTIQVEEVFKRQSGKVGGVI